jgi:cellulase
MLFLFLGLSASETSSPTLTWQRCTRFSCSPRTGRIVADKQYRSSDTAAIPDYFQALGVRTPTSSSLSQRLVTTYNGGKIIGSRVYLLQDGGTSYELFNLVDQEISYTVDLSQIPCGVSASLYMVEMSQSGDGTTGAAYGSGYCDPNFLGGSGCASVNLQNANQKAIQFAFHPCQTFGRQPSGSPCDAVGCGFNAYKYGQTSFWGTSISTQQTVTVVTQFLGQGTVLNEIRRFYIQNGRILDNAAVRIGGSSFDSITDNFCQSAGFATGDWHTLNKLGESFGRGLVLVFSLWDADDLGWLDGQNGQNGPCSPQPRSQIELGHPDMTVTWSNLKVGDLDCTY